MRTVWKRAALLAVVLGVAAALLVDRPAPQPPPTVDPAPAVPVDVETPAPAPVEVAPSPAPLDGAVTFDNGFCSTSGGESFELKFSLERLLLTELRRRAADGADPEGQPDSRRLLEVLGKRPSEQRLATARETASRWPDSVLAQAGLAIAAQAAQLPDEHLAAVRSARRLAPQDPGVGWALAAATRESADLDEAVEGLATYLHADPSPGVSRLRARLEVQRELQRDYQRLTRNGVTMLWPATSLTPRQADDVALTVDGALDDAAALTGTQRRPRLTVVVYPGRSELLAVSCVRSWTGALFDGTLRLIAGTSPDGVDRGELKHEALHAQLSPFAPAAPKWFHEGVAQSFAQEPAPKRKWHLMVQNRVWVPFSSLDGTFQAFDAASDAELAYAQAYAMVEFMRAEGGDAAINIALTAFQSGADTQTALTRACRRPVDGAQLLTFLEQRLAR